MAFNQSTTAEVAVLVLSSFIRSRQSGADNTYIFAQRLALFLSGR